MPAPMQTANIHVLTQGQPLLTQLLKQKAASDDYSCGAAIATSLAQSDHFYELGQALIDECNRQAATGSPDAVKWKSISQLLNSALDLASGLERNSWVDVDK